MIFNIQIVNGLLALHSLEPWADRSIMMVSRVLVILRAETWLLEQNGAGVRTSAKLHDIHPTIYAISTLALNGRAPMTCT